MRKNGRDKERRREGRKEGRKGRERRDTEQQMDEGGKREDERR